MDEEQGNELTGNAADQPASGWDYRAVRLSRSPVSPTISQGNRYLAVGRKWTDCQHRGPAAARRG